MHIDPDALISAQLPERAYRLKLRGQLKKHRQSTRMGGLSLAKACLALVANSKIDLLGEFAKERALARVLDYWCNEDGDIKDARVILLVEELLRRVDSRLDGPATLRDQILNLGRGFARFLQAGPTVPRAAATSSPNKSRDADLARPGVYVSTSGDRATSRPAPGSYFVVIDIKEPDFYIAQHLTCQWTSSRRSPVVSIAYVGFLFPKADPPRVLMRDPLTLENNILTPFVRPDAGAIAKVQSQLLSYAWSLGSGTAPDGASDSFADVWKTTEWQSHRDYVEEIARHRMWEFGLPPSGSLGSARGGVSHRATADEAIAAGADLAGFVDLTLGSQVNALTPLHRAAFEADVEAVATLLAQGWDPLRPDGIGRLAIDLAYASGNAEMVALLEPLTYPDGAAADE
jgi:hypothetical protein